MKRHLVAVITSSVLMISAPTHAQEASRFLSGLHGGGNLTLFANQAGEFDPDRYVSEGALYADISIFRFTPATHLVWSITCATGMGESTASGLPFSVQEVRYALIPLIETVNDSYLIRYGLDHGCDHLILKDTRDPWYVRNEEQVLRDVYDNRLFAGIGSSVHRRAAWRQRQRDPDRDAPPWIHYVEIGHFLQDFFGLFDEEALNEGNDWWWDLQYDLRCRLWNGRAGDLFATNRLHVMLDREDEIYWRDRVGIEFQLAWHPVDEHPRDSKEELVELTARFFF